MKRIWLRDARRKAKLTQAQLAAIVGCPQNYISRWELTTEPSVSEAIAIARALDVDVEALRFGKAA